VGVRVPPFAFFTCAVADGFSGIMTNNINKWIKHHIFTPGPLNYSIIIMLTLLLAVSYCSVRKEPSKVWDIRGKIILLAGSLTGLPYKYGGEEIYGFDCSGFVYYVYDAFGIKLPRTANRQAALKGKIKFKNAKPADILCFRIDRRWHTAIYTGKNTFIHAPNKRSRVRMETLNKTWRKHLKHAIRIINE
jgi:hypothetical protein